MNAMEKMTAARSFLIQRHPFLSVHLLGLPIEEDAEIDTAATDGRSVRFNSAWIETLDQEQVVSVEAHEVLHVAFAHHLRRGQRNLKGWNAAADYVVNAALAASGVKLFPGALLDSRFDDWSTEAVYDALMDEADQQASAAAASGGGEVSPEDFIPAGPEGTVEDMKAEDGGELQATERAAAEAELAVTNYQAQQCEAMQAGAGVDGAGARAVRALSPGLDARALFADFLKATMGREDYTWRRPNPRYLASSRVYLPALAQGGDLELVAVIDTSGSIRPRHLDFMAGALEDIFGDYPGARLTVVYADSRVRDFEEVTAQDCPLKLERCKGGGGTRFVPVFDWIAKQGLEPRVVAFLTDLDPFDRPEEPGYPVVWLSVDSYAPDMPFGHRINLNLHRAN